MSYPIPPNEARRIEALRNYGILDSAPEKAFDDFALLASNICGTPISLITLVDSDRQWMKAKIGISQSETPREQAFCAHTIMSSDMLVVEDATKDARFSENPLVTSEPNIRFYAGAPLVDHDGMALGSLCVIDREPRMLTAMQYESLTALSRLVVAQFEYRRIAAELAETLAELKSLSGMLPICGHCKSIRSDDGYWKKLEDYISAHSEVGFSHGICPDCVKFYFSDLSSPASESKVAENPVQLRSVFSHSPSSQTSSPSLGAMRSDG